MPHFRSSPLVQDRMGMWIMSHGRPRIIPVVDFSRTRRQMFSVCNCPTWSWRGPTERSLEMKLLADPELMRTEISEEVRVIIVESGVVLRAGSNP